MERGRFRFDYGILLAIGLIALAVIIGMIRMGWSDTLELDLIQGILGILAVACGITYLVARARSRTTPVSSHPERPTLVISHNPPRPGLPIDRDRVFEDSQRKRAPQVVASRSPEERRRPRSPQQAGKGAGGRSTPEIDRMLIQRVQDARSGQQDHLPPLLQPSGENSAKPRRRRRRRGGRGKGKAPSVPPLSPEG